MGSHSSFVHGLPSSHTETNPVQQGLKTSRWEQPSFGWQLSIVQLFPSSQGCSSPAKHNPSSHLPSPVQASPSSQTPSLGTFKQPSLGSQESVVHGLLSSQEMAEALQAPSAHVPASKHALPNVQAVPDVLKIFLHPDCGSQESTVQSFLSSQVETSTSHTPAAQKPVSVQGSLSSQVVPFGAVDHSFCESDGAHTPQSCTVPVSRHAPLMKH